MRAAPTGAARRLSPAGQLKNASSRHSLGLHIRKRCFGRWAIPRRYGRPVFQPPKRLSRVIPLLVSLAAGALLGTAFGHLLPESVERIGSGRKLWGRLLAGLMTFFVLERFLCVWCSGSSNPIGQSTPIPIFTATFIRLQPCIPTSTDLCLATGRWSRISFSERPFTA